MYVAEYYGTPSTGEIYEYYENPVSKQFQQRRHTRSKFNLLLFLKAVFLPQGYPESVSKDYVAYQIWDTVQAFCSSITGTLATHAVLKASGVGDESATVVAATMTWLLKDGTGMVGRITFAYLYGTSLDANAKQWRLFADVLNDCAICIQLLAPMLPKVYFTPVMCTAGLAFSLVGVAGGCTRAALTVHQAKRNNMADVSAKDGSQETLVNLCALMTSLMITPMLANNGFLIWTLFMLFTAMHVYANYCAVSCVVMETFNRLRFDMAFTHFCADMSLKPDNGNYLEPLFNLKSYSWLKLGCKVEDLRMSEKELTDAISLCKIKKHMFLIKFNKAEGIVHVALADSATSRDIIIACFFAFAFKRGIELKQNGQQFLDKMEADDWDLSRHHMCADEWRWSEDTKFHVQAKQKFV